MNPGAVFSECRTWRYRLARRWLFGRGRLLFVMLNPSTADELRNDPTVERCERRARAAGFQALEVCNVFAFRSTDPADMMAARDPVGPDNDRHILEAAAGADLIVCAWGTYGRYLGRGDAVRRMLEQAGHKLHALRLTAAGDPAHPLYLPYDLQPFPLEPLR